ncbi:MAG: hypothetical protein AAGA17_01335 [Actinomycetota bacterium]
MSRTEPDRKIGPKANEPASSPTISAAANGVDRTVELLSRWLAVRTSRRSFLGRLARVAVLVATGPTLAVMLARRAEARVCGQTGVTPKCPTFDCDGEDDVWGWCWYASPGCCANGGLKKVCDCCTVNWPNVHGYCPSGTNVRCIVESCHSDPRVMDVGLSAVTGDDAATVAAELVRGAPTTAWIVDTDPLLAASAAPLAALAGAPLLLSDGDRLHPATIRALQRHGIGRVEHAAGTVSAGALAEAARYATVAEATPGESSADRAIRVLDETGARRIIGVVDEGRSAQLAPLLAGIAAATGCPIVVGRADIDAVHAARRPVVTWLVGPEAAALAGEIAGGKPIGRATGIASALREAAARILETEDVDGLPVVLAPTAADATHIGLAAATGPVLLHGDGTIDTDTRAFLRDHQPRLTSARYVRTVGSLTAAGIWETQSAVNHYDTHQLRGGSGEGLPVFSQPRAEREIGRARISAFRADELVEDESPYWLARANPDRTGR